MKKTLYVLALCLLALPALAQVQPGAIYTGTHFNGSIKKDGTTSKTTTFNIDPTVGYFINSNWMVGIHARLGFSNSIIEQQLLPPADQGYSSYLHPGSTEKTSSFNIGPVARYYTGLSNKFDFFLEGTVGYAMSNSNFVSGHGSRRDTHYGLYSALAPGAAFFPIPKLGIEMKVNLLSYTTQYGGDFDASLNLGALRLGAGYYW